MKIIFGQAKHINNFNKLRVCNINDIFASLAYKYAIYLQQNHIFKKHFQNFAKAYMTQLRLGILPLHTETDRFTPIYDKSLKKKRSPSKENVNCVT